MPQQRSGRNNLPMQKHPVVSSQPPMSLFPESVIFVRTIRAMPGCLWSIASVNNELCRKKNKALKRPDIPLFII
jgi:hypothetical protein